MTRRRQPIVPHQKTESTRAVTAQVAPSAAIASLFDPWAWFDSFAKLSGFPLLSPEMNQARVKNWAILWEDQMRRFGFYLKWPLGMG